MPFVCHNKSYLPYIKGEADLVYKNNKFFLFQTIEVPEDNIRDVEKFIGVDFGITDIATLSDGTNFSSEKLNTVREKRFKVRKSVQGKCTQGAKKLLKRLGGRERRFAAITNHTIAKRIVEKAKFLSMGIAIEDLKGIHQRTKVRKSQRRKHRSWSFFQLRAFIEYKARLIGIPVVAVAPAYTSQTCNVCKWIGKRSGKHFECPNCGNIADADVNAAKNIAQLALLVNQGGKNQMFSSIVHRAS
jgi:IS605 OrfB family transposase